MAVKTRTKDNTSSKVIGGGTGAAGGAAAGAAIGSPGGPVGMAVGAVIGGITGALAGTAIADAVDPEVEEKYWENEYTKRPYYTEGKTYDEYRPAYRYGVEAANKHPDQPFTDVEKRLSRSWPRTRGESTLTWSKAKDAARDAYERTLQLREERLTVEKQDVSKGDVAVRKEVVTERQRIDVPVEREEVVITRRPARGQAKPGGLTADATSAEIRIPVKEQRVTVKKETVPIEEVTVGRRKVRSVEKIDESVRKERLATDTKGGASVRQERAPSR